MGGVESVDVLIDMIRANSDISHYASGCDESTIGAAERVLGIKFPPSYRRFIAKFGTADVAGQEFLGVYQTPGAGQVLLGSVAATLDARRCYSLPDHLVVTMFDGMGGLIVLDSSRSDMYDEYPVVVWNPGTVDEGDMEVLGANFGHYALNLCRIAIEGWRNMS
ncbi:SMI1/KNR4 family protein [Frankia gtarii]|uniref:SMI1/KNR4 family protein n=1 Tax=Frankia gtarii TaxID=2950102 RepID=UPI0021C09DB6|nr:SMI1/KNR4 family protein [Frankia gtarii]